MADDAATVLPLVLTGVPLRMAAVCMLGLASPLFLLLAGSAVTIEPESSLTLGWMEVELASWGLDGV